MENGLDAQKIAEHYGYSKVSPMHGCRKFEAGALEQLRHLPEVLDETKKIRIIFDYDPELSRVLVQIFED